MYSTYEFLGCVCLYYIYYIYSFVLIYRTHFEYILCIADLSFQVMFFCCRLLFYWSPFKLVLFRINIYG